MIIPPNTPAAGAAGSLLVVPIYDDAKAMSTIKDYAKNLQGVAGCSIVCIALVGGAVHLEPPITVQTNSETIGTASFLYSALHLRKLLIDGKILSRLDKFIILLDGSKHSKTCALDVLAFAFPEVADMTTEVVSGVKPNMRATAKLNGVEKDDLAVWRTLPLYMGTPFPEVVYNAAVLEHKHYDSLSHVVVAGMLASFVAPLSLNNLSDGVRPVCCVGAILAIWVFFTMYQRLAVYAMNGGESSRFLSTVIKCEVSHP